ncbi:MAG: cold shock domain-containing protein [candidate division NC10 bacterium]|nr:cold shock domain-containing protein [candidate division NC10 bacterium]
MARGTIKRLIKDRGFGFIKSEDGREIFFHRSALSEREFDALEEGQGVEFEVERGPKGPRAVNVKPSPAKED